MAARNIKLKVGKTHFNLKLNAGGGSVESNLLDKNSPVEGIQANLEVLEEFVQQHRYEACVDGVESLLLALACAGVDVESKQFKAGLESALDAIANKFD